MKGLDVSRHVHVEYISENHSAINVQRIPPNTIFIHYVTKFWLEYQLVLYIVLQNNTAAPRFGQSTPGSNADRPS